MVEFRATALARVAASSDPLPVRAQALLVALRSIVPFDAAWLAFADRLRGTYVTLASLQLDEDTVAFLAGPATAYDIGVTGADLPRPPLSVSDLPYPAEQPPTWRDCLTPAGFQESLAVALFAPGGRHVGFLMLLFAGESPPSATTRRRLGELAPVLALGIDPMPSLLGIARLVRGVTAGRLVRDDGLTDSLSGLDGDPLFEAGSPVLAMACQRLQDGTTHSTFLWPVGGWHAPDGHVRVTVLAAPDDLPAVLGGLALISPTGDLRELTPRELEVLGLVIHGCSNQEIAQTLVLAPRTVATHLEHVLAKLVVTTRTLAAVRAEREGLYVPVGPGSPYDVAECGERGP